jgi:WD40 repeat protein/tRNA A-37 threonylcarbamoyl transferase component Bud32
MNPPNNDEMPTTPSAIPDSSTGEPTTPGATQIFRPVASDEATAEIRARDPRTPTIPGYEILGILGRGGMGVVYKARHLALNRMVALKMILAGEHALDEERVRFLAEAEVVARLQHPHIVQVFEVGEADGRPYCALELVEGGNLASQLARAPLPPTEAARLVELVARAMHAAHTGGVVHRDLKPANVLLAADGSPKITDFGLARLLDSDSGQTRSGQVLGTPSYIAPEQAAGQGRAAGPAADVYALGAILYECLTGRPPFRGSTALETLDQVRTKEPVRVRHLQPNTSRDLETICHKCLEKEPARRYRSADELANDLRRFQDGLPVLARPVGNVERLVCWGRRNPIVAGLLGALLTVLAAVFVASAVAAVYFRQQADELGKALKTADDNRITAEGNFDRAERERKEANEARLRTERALGTSRLAQSLTVWRAGNIFLARTFCEEVPPEARSWEWRYLRQQYTGGLFTRIDSDHQPVCVAFAPEGRLLATGGNDGAIKFWDAEDGHFVRTWSGHAGTVWGIVFSPNGDKLASAGADRRILIRNSETGVVLRTLEDHGAEVLAIAWSPNGKQLASASADKSVRLWDAATGKPGPVLTAHQGRVNGVAFSPDGKRLASVSDDGTLCVWEATTGTRVRTLDTDHRALSAVCFSPNGRWLAGGGAHQLIRLWDANTGDEVRTLDQTPYKGIEKSPVDNHVTWLAFSPDGRQLATCCGKGMRTKPGALVVDVTIRLWSPDNGQLLFTYATHTAPVLALSYSSDGRRLASVSPLVGQLKVWDARNSPEYRSGPYPGRCVTDVCYSPDGRHLATASGDQRFRSNPEGVILSDAVTGQVERTLPHPMPVQCVAFLRDGAFLVTGGNDGNIRLWEAAKGREVRVIPAHQGVVWSVSASPDGTRIASAGTDGKVRLWDADSGHLVREHQRPGVMYSVCFGPGGELAAGGEGKAAAGELLLWRPGDEIPRMLGGHTRTVARVRFSPDGRRLASGSWDTTVRIRDVAGESDGLLLHGHTHLVSGLSFSPDGERMASADRDGIVRLWDTTSGQEVLTLAGPDPQTLAVCFSPDGRRLAAGGGSTDPSSLFKPGEVRVWDTGRLRPAVVLTGSASPIAAIWFSKDDSSLLACDTAGQTVAWSLPDSRFLGEKDEKPPRDAVRQAESHGQTFSASCQDDHSISLVDLRDTDEDRAELRALAQPDPAWHIDRVRRYTSFGPLSDWPQPFAAGFHARQALRLQPNDPSMLKTLATYTQWLATESRHRGDPIAEEQKRDALSLFERLAAASPNDPDCQRTVAAGLLTPDWLILKPSDLTSTGGATLKLQPDGSIRVDGKNPERDSFLLTTPLPPGGLTGFRLEVLPDPTQKNLPGRAPSNGNFELSEMSLTWTAPGKDPKSVPLAFAWCDYSAPASQHYFKKDMRIEWAFDGDPQTAWNTFPSLSLPHAAVFDVRDPLVAIKEGTVTFRLDFQGPNPQHSLGYFRLSATTSPRPAAAERWRAALLGRPVSAWTIVAASAYLRGDWQTVKSACLHAVESPSGSTAFDTALLAVARGHLGEKEECREALLQARALAAREPVNALLTEVLNEATHLLDTRN